MRTDVVHWLLDSDEPWTRYRTLVDLLGCSEDEPRVQTVRAEMLTHPLVQGLADEAGTWPGYALKRHNDARHPLYRLSTLADFGLRYDDPIFEPALEAVLAHQSEEGAFQSLINVPTRFGGTGEDEWSWMLCDAPTLLYSLLAAGLGKDPRVVRAVRHMVDQIEDNGWRCGAAVQFGSRFRGPGRKADPCPIANVYALKALSQVPAEREGEHAQTGAETLLNHWERQTERKIYLFGIGTDFRKLKYPFVWYDILHVVDVLSRFRFVGGDHRFREMVEAITSQADSDGRYTATSMYRAWKGWSFAGKKQPSPWLTFLATRIFSRLEADGPVS
jgi:hypothetical protein